MNVVTYARNLKDAESLFKKWLNVSRILIRYVKSQKNFMIFMKIILTLVCATIKILMNIGAKAVIIMTIAFIMLVPQR